MTWAALDRGAAAAPAIPGYGVEDQDHPAHSQDDPGKDDYNIGGPSEFAEDVHPPPYGDSGPPAIPGYGVEDQDHPAHAGQVGRQASLMELVRRKSAKALVLAKATLTRGGKTASWGDIEDQAFGFMSMDDDALDASIGRLGGDFLGMEDELRGMFPDEEFGEAEMLDEEETEAMSLEGRLKAMETELLAMRAAASRRADQNDPNGETLGADGKSEAEEKAEEAAANKEAARDPFMAMFDSYDTDGDGFVTVEDWGGPRAMFASLDTDGDGIIARHEVLAGCEKLPNEAMQEACEAKKKASDDEDGKDASKVAFGHMAELDEDELELLQAMQFGMDDLGDEVVGCGDVMASKKAKKADDDEAEDDEDDAEVAGKKSDDDEAEDDEDDAEVAGKKSGKKAKKDADDEGGDDDEAEEGSDKEASDAEFFQTGFDPMGLSDGTQLTAADDAAFREVFGSDEDGDEKEGEDDEGSDKEASLAAMLQPQKRKASTGVKSVGTVSKTAKAGKGNEIAELSSLWASDPDVSGSFS